MVEEEEKSRPRIEARDTGLTGIPKETNMAHKGIEERYHDTTEEGSEEDALERCRERQVEVNTEISIADMNKDWRFWARQPKTPNIGEESPCRACAIEGKTATDSKEPVAMDKSGAGRKDPSSPS